MEFDPGNKIVQRCVLGLEREGEGMFEEAGIIFYEAWSQAENDFEKFIAAHYVARHQKTLSEKLNWDIIALNLAKNLDSEMVGEFLPSLYLNIAKGYEDLDDLENAREHYYWRKGCFHVFG